MVSGEWPDRLRVLLLSAALEMAVLPDLDTVLQRIVEGAASVVDARYAALGVYDDAGKLTTFVHHGFDEATIEADGDGFDPGERHTGAHVVADVASVNLP